jgi:hypothetical protein
VAHVCQDSHIRELENEIAVLGQDKVTITKLASEAGVLRESLKDLEAREEEVRFA